MAGPQLLPLLYYKELSGGAFDVFKKLLIEDNGCNKGGITFSVLMGKIVSQFRQCGQRTF